MKKYSESCPFQFSNVHDNERITEEVSPYARKSIPYNSVHKISDPIEVTTRVMESESSDFFVVCLPYEQFHGCLTTVNHGRVCHQTFSY